MTKKKDYGTRKPSDLLVDMANSLKHDTREASSTSSVVDFTGPSTSTVQQLGRSRRPSLFSLIPTRKLDNQRDEAETARIEKEEYMQRALSRIEKQHRKNEKEALRAAGLDDDEFSEDSEDESILNADSSWGLLASSSLSAQTMRFTAEKLPENALRCYRILETLMSHQSATW